MENEKLLSWLQVFKATVIATAVALVATLAFAGVLRTTNLSQKSIVPVNFIIKAISVLVGCLCALRGEKGWLRGSLSGLLFVFLSGLLFSTLGGGLSISWLLVVELAFGVFVGALSGIFAVNIKGN